MQAIATTSFAHVPPEMCLKILQWGMNPNYVREEKIPPKVLQTMVSVIISGMNQNLAHTLDECMDLAAKHYPTAA